MQKHINLIYIMYGIMYVYQNDLKINFTRAISGAHIPHAASASCIILHRDAVPDYMY